ncbi:MAG: winged helix-turn-helix transcriptional regulator [Lachnospiraceae bacterium]|nr:winged helix-turn-helix transcriptional regulator [Lachnospiraceae bacterium]
MEDLKYATPEQVAKIQKELPDEDGIYALSELFKIFGDSTRLKILLVLYSGEMCVYDIAKTLDMSQSSISHQLKNLKQSRLVKFRRDGKATFYSLDDEHVFSIMREGLEHVQE